MNRRAHIFASIITIAVLTVTPAVATLCAMLCSSATVSTAATVEPHHGHHAAEAAHDGHTAEPAAAEARHHGSAPAQLTAQPGHACCDGESLAPRALTTRRLDSGTVSSASAIVAAAPLLSFSTAALARTPAARFDAHLVSRPPLVLRI